MDIINKDKLLKLCKEQWEQHKEIFKAFWGLKDFDQYFAMISKQADIFLSLPDDQKHMFAESHLKMTEKTYRDISRTLNNKYDIGKNRRDKK